MKKCKSKSKKYEDGGVLQSALPLLPAALGMINPLLGTAASVGVNMYQQNQAQDVPQSSSVVNTNPYGFEMGGKLIGSERASIAMGQTHAQGGIKVTPEGIPTHSSNQEIEDGEVIYTTKKGEKYVFSNKLKIK